MKRTITLATFRKLERAEETMLRAVMPRIAAADPAPLASNLYVPARRTWSAGSLVVKTGFTLQEVARG